MSYYFGKFFKFALMIGYLFGVFWFCHYTFQMDTGPPLGEEKVESLDSQDDLENCWEEAQKAKQNFNSNSSVENWKAWSELDKLCREADSLALP